MPELRWTLAVVGALFIVGLALWEFRRQRQAPRQSANPGAPAGSERVTPTLEGGVGEGTRLHREPIITLPELHPEPRVEPRLTARREPAHDPPIVEVDDASFSRLHVAGATVEVGIAATDEDTIAMPVDDTGTTVDEAGPSVSASAAASMEDAEAEAGDAESMRPGTPPQAGSVAQADAPVGFVGESDEHEAGPPGAAQTSPARAAPSTAHAHPAGATADGAPIVDWPSEESRKIVALRLVSSPAARFPGRAVRQALAAEGFVLGKFDIFHKAGPDERCVLSAASLTKPGTFAMNTIDAQRFGGISLFAVLPGPLPPQQTFDELLSTARNLNNRLQGALQDERGEPLTPMRSASIRQSLSEGNGSKGSGAGAGPQPETRQ